MLIITFSAFPLTEISISTVSATNLKPMPGNPCKITNNARKIQNTDRLSPRMKLPHTIVFKPPHTMRHTKKREPRNIICSGAPRRTAATYSPTWSGSTIGDDGLSFSVRNGKRRFPVAIATAVYNLRETRRMTDLFSHTLHFL